MAYYRSVARVALVMALPLLGSVYSVHAQGTPQSDFSPQAYPDAFKALFLLFVLAVILESALAILFNWRPFVETFNARAVRPIVSFLVATLLVAHFNLDLISTLAGLIRPDVPAFDWTGRILTAMVIAGGSAGVNNLMVSLGFRQARTPDTIAPKPPATKGWISVSIVRKQAVGPVSIFIGPEVDNKTPLAGVLDKSTRTGWTSYFLRDPGRFPGYGGYAVQAGSEVHVLVSAVDSGGNAVTRAWGPNVIADGAIIDLKFEL